MSKHNRKNVNETVNEAEEIVEGEVTQEEEEMKEKKGFFYGVGTVAGKVVGGTTKALKSKPAKIIGTVAAIGLAAKLGYDAGKNGTITIGRDDSLDSTETEDTNSEAPSEVVADETT